MSFKMILCQKKSRMSNPPPDTSRHARRALAEMLAHVARHAKAGMVNVSVRLEKTG